MNTKKTRSPSAPALFLAVAVAPAVRLIRATSTPAARAHANETLVTVRRLTALEALEVREKYPALKIEDAGELPKHEPPADIPPGGSLGNESLGFGDGAE